MPWGLGTDIQLRRLDYQQMMDEGKQNPGVMRRRACMACVTPIVVVFMLLTLWLVINLL